MVYVCRWTYMEKGARFRYGGFELYSATDGPYVCKITDYYQTERYIDASVLALRKWPAMVNHSSKKTTINCELTDPVFGEFAEPYLKILKKLRAGTMLYCDYGEEYWKGREHGIVEGTFRNK